MAGARRTEGESRLFDHPEPQRVDASPERPILERVTLPAASVSFGRSPPNSDRRL